MEQEMVSSGREVKTAGSPARPARARGRTREEEAPALTYVYCLVQGASSGALRGVCDRVPGTGSLRALDLGQTLCAVVADADPAAFSAEALLEGFDDLDWVGRCAVGHEAVVSRLMATHASVLPLKLFTLFASDGRAVAALGRGRARYTRLLARIAGCSEWGVRLETSTTSQPAGLSDASSGAEFLSRKLRARRDEQTRRRSFPADAARVYRDLAPLARAARRVRPAERLRPAVSAVMDAVFLVHRSRVRAFRARARTLAAGAKGRGQRLTVTGPWAPYHFIGRDGTPRR
jgi:hypothetical protein